MEQTDVLIIGAGAAGLMAAYTLAKAGRNVIILEARNRIGGRIHTIDDASFSRPVELGAEFIHGNLALTLSLLQQAGIPFHKSSGEMYTYARGKLHKGDGETEGWDLLMEKMNALEKDVNLEDFLHQYFGDSRFDALKTEVRRYVSGYDTADPFRVSTFALRDEWQNEEEDQYRVDGGYRELVKYLATEIESAGGRIYLNSAVTGISWQQGRVEALTKTGESFAAGSVVMALPLGVWQAAVPSEGTINFHPAIPVYTEALQQLGFGSIIKVLLKFKERFWDEEMNMLLSAEVIPTWWTQAPDQSGYLTGWLGGLPATRFAGKSKEEILKEALQSLATIFKLQVETLTEQLLAWKIIDWATEPYTRGSYAYDTVGAPEIRALLRQPIAGTLHFAGEFMYEGHAMGTVEAALVNGKEVATQVLSAAT